MKARSKEKLPIIEIEKNQGEAVVTLRTNFIEENTEDGKEWVFEHYYIKTSYRQTLEESILNDFDLWITIAKEQEIKALDVEYENRVNRYIREKYTLEQEQKITREYMSYGEEYKNKFDSYNLYVEECKIRAREEIYGG